MNRDKLPQIKKDIKAFLTSEEGRINKKDVAKTALGLTVLGMGLAGVMKPDPTLAGPCGVQNYCPKHCSY